MTQDTNAIAQHLIQLHEEREKLERRIRTIDKLMKKCGFEPVVDEDGEVISYCDHCDRRK